MSGWRLFDSHCHLNDPGLLARADELLVRAAESGVRRIVVPGYDRDSSLLAIELAQRYDGVYAAVGFHPQDAANVTPEDLGLLRTWCGYDKVVAIGEIGLDYHYDDPPPSVQQEVFRVQLELARELDLPVVVHDRDAHTDILRLLGETRASDAGGVMHCFSGGTDLAQACVRLNFYISFAGPVTFKNAKRPVQAAQSVPADRLLIETDAPWLTPEPHRGRMNEPAYVRFVLERLAEIRGELPEDLAEQTFENALRAFRL